MAAKKISLKSSSPSVSLSSVYRTWAWILLAWALYRYFTNFPEAVDEFIFKPLVFVAPVIWYVLKVEKQKLATIGLTMRNFFSSIYIGLGFGVVFAIEGVVTHALKYGGSLNVNPISAFQQYGFFLIIISIATAFSEELLSRGFVFNRIYEKTKNLPWAALLSSFMFMALHVPILLTSNKLTGVTLVLFFVTDFILSLANSLLYYNTGSLVAPILVHIFWNMTVALYL
jgi:membrane protease YdiL (CAAX protease family)